MPPENENAQSLIGRFGTGRPVHRAVPGDPKCKECRGTIAAYPATFFPCFLTFAHHFFAALTIAALPAADKTRFFAPTTSRSAEPPNAFAAARTPLNWEFSLPSCFWSFLSSRLIAARIFAMGRGSQIPPTAILP